MQLQIISPDARARTASASNPHLLSFALLSAYLLETRSSLRIYRDFRWLVRGEREHVEQGYVSLQCSSTKVWGFVLLCVWMQFG